MQSSTKKPMTFHSPVLGTVMALGVLIALSFVCGCHLASSSSDLDTTGTGLVIQPMDDADTENAPQEVVSMAGAQLWEQNCIRCHNYRPARSFSDAQWDIIMHHMRVRANLTAQESRQILAFLKAAN